jgi:hypothetical protein
MSNNNTDTNNSSTTIDEERIGKLYMRPTKLVYDEHGRKIAVPDIKSLSSPFSSNAVVHRHDDDNNNNNTAAEEDPFDFQVKTKKKYVTLKVVTRLHQQDLNRLIE